MTVLTLRRMMASDAEIPVRMHLVFFLQSHDVTHHVNTSCDTQTTFLRLPLNRSLKMFFGGRYFWARHRFIAYPVGFLFRVRSLMITSLGLSTDCADRSNAEWLKARKSWSWNQSEQESTDLRQPTFIMFVTFNADLTSFRTNIKLTWVGLQYVYS